MVALPPVDQDLFIQADPLAFIPVKGAWGKQGATNVRLSKARNGAGEEGARDRLALSDREEREGASRPQARGRPC
jgi:hypothetical protein